MPADPLRTEVSFTSDRDSESDVRHAGLDLADELVRALTEAGFTCSVIEDLDYAHAFRVVVGTRHFYVLAGKVGDGVRDWLVSTNSELNRLRWLLGERDRDEHRVLTSVLHRFLSQAPGIDNVRWYTLADWNEDPDRRWEQTPG